MLTNSQSRGRGHFQFECRILQSTIYEFISTLWQSLVLMWIQCIIKLWRQFFLELWVAISPEYLFKDVWIVNSLGWYNVSIWSKGGGCLLLIIKDLGSWHSDSFSLCNLLRLPWRCPVWNGAQATSTRKGWYAGCYCRESLVQESHVICQHPCNCGRLTC